MTRTTRGRKGFNQERPERVLYLEDSNDDPDTATSEPLNKFSFPIPRGGISRNKDCGFGVVLTRTF